VTPSRGGGRGGRRTEAWTIGYQGRTVPELVRILTAARVERLLDVRERPQSRKPGFSKASLSRSLAAAGVGYVHRPELGTPAPIRNRYKRRRDFVAFRVEYERLLATRTKELAEATRLLRERRTALFCFERDPNECHRSVLCRRLARRKIAFTHLGLEGHKGTP
jgi:uncharacterized protein (DUF488 family)